MENFWIISESFIRTASKIFNTSKFLNEERNNIYRKKLKMICIPFARSLDTNIILSRATTLRV